MRRCSAVKLSSSPFLVFRSGEHLYSRSPVQASGKPLALMPSPTTHLGGPMSPAPPNRCDLFEWKGDGVWEHGGNPPPPPPPGMCTVYSTVTSHTSANSSTISGFKKKAALPVLWPSWSVSPWQPKYLFGPSSHPLCNQITSTPSISDAFLNYPLSSQCTPLTTKEPHGTRSSQPNTIAPP